MKKKKKMKNPRTKILQLARTTKKLLGSQKILINIKKEQNLVRNSKNSSKESSTNTSKDASREHSPVYTFQGIPHHVPTKPQSIILNIWRNFFIPIKQRRWEALTISFFVGIFLISPHGFSFLRKLDIGPSKNTVIKYMKESYYQATDDYLDINKITNIAKQYRKQLHIDTKDRIFGILAVDAISTSTQITIDSSGKVTGLITSVNLSKDETQKLKQIIKYQENMFLKLKKQHISDCFVFQFQPLSPMFLPFVVHIQPSNSGKANNSQIILLKKISLLLEVENFTTLSFAADGDSGYKPLVNKTLFSYEYYQPRRPFLNIDDPLFTNDPLHLLKRARYRLLSHKLVPVLKTDNFINSTKLQEILDEPQIVFHDAYITKMRDDLPIKLFSLSNFILLFEAFEDEGPASYFLPFTLLIEALDSDTLTIDERIDFFEISFYYLLFYKKILSKIPIEERYPQSCSKQQKCSMFSFSLIDDILTTILTINSILNQYHEKLSLNRIGTNPLEHHFGLLRMRCKYKHNFNNILQNEKRINILLQIESELSGTIIRGRKDTFGVKVKTKCQEYGEKYGYSNKIMAIALLSYFNIPIDKLNVRLSACDKEVLLAIFSSKIDVANRNKGGSTKQNNKRIISSSSKIGFNLHSGQFIRKRQMEKNIFEKDAERKIEQYHFSDSQPLQLQCHEEICFGNTQMY